MNRFAYYILTLFFVFSLVAHTQLSGETSVVDSYKKQEKELSRKRFEHKEWSKEKKTDLTDKSFSFKHWNKHYSTMGSKKWDSTVDKTIEKKRFESEMMQFPTKEIELSEWQGYLANLESRAQISTDTTARIIQDKRIYEMMLQQAENYKDTGELLSLRDINRYQFRKNRPDGVIPKTNAGSGEETQ
jgi:hypothetical protein